MKIKDIQNDVSFISGLPGKKIKPDSAGVDFEQVLRNARATPEGQPKSSPSGSPDIDGNSLAMSQLLQSEKVTGMAPADQIRSEGIASAEDALRALDRYQTAMADSRITLRELEPLVRSLAQNLHVMKEVSEKLSSNDSLREIMREVGVVSSVEIERFNRGDYL